MRFEDMAIQYPPEPATSDMETMTGFFFCAICTSRWMISLATEEPPGESTRSTMDFTLASFAASRRSEAMESEHIMKPEKGVHWDPPTTMRPVACTTAILSEPKLRICLKYFPSSTGRQSP